MSKTIEQIRAELNADTPREAVQERSAGNGMSLSYLAGWYVIDRMNKVFGQGNWSYNIRELTKTFEGEINNKAYVSYIAQVELFVTFPKEESHTCNGATSFIDVGFGDGQDAKNPGKAHELAVKEAVTDGIKRCAKSLGMSMGLALYDKLQRNVSNAEEPTKNNVANINPPSAPSVTPRANLSQVKPTSNGQETKGTTAQNRTDEKRDSTNSSNGRATPSARTETKDAASIRKAIVSVAEVLEAKAVITKAELKHKFIVDAFKVNSLADLTNEQVNTLYNTLKTTYAKDLSIN